MEKENRIPNSDKEINQDLIKNVVNNEEKCPYNVGSTLYVLWNRKKYLKKIKKQNMIK